MNEATPRKRHRLRRTLIGIPSGLLAILLVAIVLLLLPPVRDRLLGLVLGRSVLVLPGNLEVGSARWPRPDRLELRDVRWTDHEDTLLDLNHLFLDLDLAGLARKDVIVRRVDAGGSLVDIGAIQSAFAAASTDSTGAQPDGAEPRFPRPGSFRGLPSVAIGKANLAVRRVVISDSVAIEQAVLAGGFTALRGVSPELRIDALRGETAQFRIDSLHVRVEYDSARATGLGYGWVGDDVPVSFRMVPSEPGEFHLDLEVGRSEPPVDGESAELHLTGTIETRDGGRLATGFTGRLHTPSSRVWRRWLSDSVSTEELEIPGIALRLEGNVELPTPIDGNIRLDFEPGEWVDSGTISAQMHDDRVTLDDLRWRLADLTVEGNGFHSPERDEMNLELNADGGQFLERIDPSWTAPESLHAVMFAMGVYSEGRWEATARAEGEAVLAELGRTAIALQARADSQSVQASIRAGARELLAETAAVLDLDAMNRAAASGSRPNALIPIRVDPIEISLLGSRALASEEAPLRELAANAARVTVSRDGNVFHVQGLRVTGALGDLSADGRLARGSSGPFTVRAEWGTFPEALGLALELTETELDSLRASWRADAPYSVRAKGQVDIGSPLSTLRFGADVRLPGPRALAPLFDQVPPVRLASMEPLTGRIEAVGLAGNQRGTRARLDLTSTGWIDRVDADVRLYGSGETATVEIDSADVWIPGGNVHAAGRMAGNERHFSGTIAIHDPTILQRFGIETVSSLRVEANAELLQNGTGTKLTAQATAAASTTTMTVPQSQVMLEWNRPSASEAVKPAGQLHATVEFPEGLAIGSIFLESARAQLDGDDALRSGRLVAEGLGEETSFSLDADVAREDQGWRAEVNGLETVYEEATLSAVQPFTLVLRPENDIELRGFEMRGSAGVISIDGRVNKLEADLVASGDLTLPETIVPLRIPAGTWPEHLRFDVSTENPDSARVLIHATGLTLGDRENLSLYTQARFGIEGTTADLLLGSETAVESMLEPEDEGSLFEALGLTDSGPEREPDSSLAAQPEEVREEELDLAEPPRHEWVEMTGDSTLALPDEILARGTAFAPFRLRVAPFAAAMDSGDLRIDLRIEDVPIPTTRADRFLLANGTLTARGTAASPRGRFQGEVAFRDWQEMEGYRAELVSSFGPDSGLVARGRLLDRDAAVLTADAVVPADLTLYPFSFKPHPDEDAHARVDAPSLDLSRFAALLPPRYSMEGKLTVQAEASGAADDPVISGHIRGREIEAQLADGSRAVGRADLDLGGTALRPAVTGRIDIENGVLEIPDQSREILPAQGSALLWAEQETTGVGGMMGPPDLRRPRPTIEPNLDVRVVIPGGLWIRGEGLDVELGGELLVRTEQMLLISGDLKALRGEYRLLGRVFEVEQGTVQFYGEDELNPALDLSLTTRVEGILFRVSLFGTVQEPELVLSSEPSLAEGDILSYLVLGRSVDDLDQNQVGLLKSRATDIAAVFGTTQLEGELERRLGFDMVSIREGSGPEQGSALVLGKYLSPRILLKYEQELGTESNFFFNLEYLLTKAVRLETLAGEEQSGVEITWQRDY